MSEAKKLLDAIGEMPEEMIAEAAEPEKLHRYSRRQRKKGYVFGGGLVAAAAALVIWGAFGNHTLLEQKGSGGGKLYSPEFSTDAMQEDQTTGDNGGTDPDLYMDSTWMVQGEDAIEEIGEIADKAQEEAIPETSEKKTYATEKGDSSQADSHSADTSGNKEGQPEASQVKLQIGETFQICPHDYLDYDGSTVNESALEEHDLGGKYFELNLEGDDADMTYQIIPKYGVSCSALTADGDSSDDFSEKTICQPGDTVRFLLQEEPEDSKATDQTARQDMAGLEESDWEERGIEPIAKVVIQASSGEPEKILYIGTEQGNYYLLINFA